MFGYYWLFLLIFVPEWRLHSSKTSDLISCIWFTDRKKKWVKYKNPQRLSLRVWYLYLVRIFTVIFYWNSKLCI